MVSGYDEEADAPIGNTITMDVPTRNADWRTLDTSLVEVAKTAFALLEATCLWRLAGGAEHTLKLPEEFALKNIDRHAKVLKLLQRQLDVPRALQTALGVNIVKAEKLMQLQQLK